MQKVAADVGYGNVKVVSERGAVRCSRVRSPAVRATSRRSWEASGARRGDYALLVLAALAAAGADDPTELALSLPLRLYLAREERSALRDRIAGLSA